MKKTIIYFFSIVLTTLLCCGCEEEKIGAYPYSKIFFIDPAYVSIKHSTSPIKEQKNWDSELYPMDIWIDETDIATVDKQGYVTGLQLGTFTLHAKVMSKHGWIEGSQLFTVVDDMIFLTSGQIDKLISLGVDKNNDGIITASEMEQTEVLDGEIHSDFLLSLAEYLPNLKEVNVIADTAQSRTLDLSMFKLRKLLILDECCRLKKSDEDYDRLKPYFLTTLKLNNSIENLILDGMPGFPVMDLSEYTNLKTISRDYALSPRWIDMTIILPPNIESIDLSSVSLQFTQILYKLTSVELAHCMPIEIPKTYAPNLKRIIYKYDNYAFSPQYDMDLDISSYEASDFEELDLRLDKLYVSQSLADNQNKFSISAREVIIK
jgi:hypothetical protein